MKRTRDAFLSSQSGPMEPIMPPQGNAIPRKLRIALMILLFVPCLFLYASLDNDLWFLFNSGRYVLAHGIPVIEPFTMHQNMGFMMQQWLSAVIFWLVYSSMGTYGVLGLVFLMLVCIVWMIYRLAMLISSGNFLASFVATLPVSILLAHFLYTRPIAFTLLILISELYLVERFIASRKVGFLIPLPVLSALLINLHAAMWFMQFVLLLPYAIDSFRFRLFPFEGQGFPKRAFFPAVLLMFAAGFLNPYGFRAMTYLFRSYGYSDFLAINEMNAPTVNNFLGIVVIGTIIVVFLVYLFKKESRTKLRFALLTFGTALLALSAMRNYVLFLVCGIFPLAYILRDIQLPKPKEKPTKATLRLRVILLAFLTLGIIYLGRSQVDALIKASLPPPVAAPVNYLLAQGKPEDMVLFTGYNDGGYAEFMGFAPYIDARAEVFVEKNNGQRDIMHEYCSMLSGDIYYKDVLDEYQFTHLLVSKDDILNAYLPHDADYQPVYQDDTYFVYQRIQ